MIAPELPLADESPAEAPSPAAAAAATHLLSFQTFDFKHLQVFGSAFKAS